MSTLISAKYQQEVIDALMADATGKPLPKAGGFVPNPTKPNVVWTDQPHDVTRNQFQVGDIVHVEGDGSVEGQVWANPQGEVLTIWQDQVHPLHLIPLKEQLRVITQARVDHGLDIPLEPLEVTLNAGGKQETWDLSAEMTLPWLFPETNGPSAWWKNLKAWKMNWDAQRRAEDFQRSEALEAAQDEVLIMEELA